MKFVRNIWASQYLSNSFGIRKVKGMKQIMEEKFPNPRKN